MKKLLKFALEYALRGWYIFPVRECDGELYQDDKGNLKLPKAKSPRIRHGLLNATTDAQQITEWWTRWPYAAIGCNCGKSGLFAFDVDRKDGRDGWPTFKALGLEWDKAFCSITPSGGLHIIYSGIGKSTANTATGLDTKSDGGYIILPPSEIEGKGEYIQSNSWEGVPATIDAEVLARLFPEHEQPERRNLAPLSQADEVQKAKRAIAALPGSLAQDYDIKIKIGMALQALGSDGLTLWHEFCKKDNRQGKYNSGELDEHWERLNPGRVTIGTLYYYANQNCPEWRKS